MTGFDGVQLDVTRISYLRPACDSGRHVQHPELTCAEADTLIAADQDAIQRAVDRIVRQLDTTPMRDVPAALRGPRWETT